MPRTFKDDDERRLWETQVLSDLKVQERSVIESGQYCQSLCEALIKAVDADMSKTSYRLLNYLSGLYPFNDRYIELPNQSELALRLGVTRQSINSAQAEIQSAGLWDFRIEKWKGRNLVTKQTAKTPPQVSKKLDRCQKNLTPYQKNLTPCQEDLTPQTLEPSDSNSSSTSQISSDPFKKREREENNFSKELPACGKLIPLAEQLEITNAENCQATELQTFEGVVSVSKNTQKGNDSAANDDPKNFKTYVSFESGECNWTEYAGPGFGGSSVDYYVYRRAQVVLLAAERERQKAEGRRVRRIPEVDAYTRTCIRNGGAEEFDDWVREGKPLEPVAVVPKSRSKRSSTATAGTTATATLSATATPILTPAQVLENRKRSLCILFESGKVDAMHELLDRWSSLKDGIVPQLLKQCPEWGFSWKRDRVVLSGGES